MDIKLKGKPAFNKKNAITMDLAGGNRIYGRAESLQHCLYSAGFHYEIDFHLKPDSKKLILRPLNGLKRISDCEQLEQVLESCGFQMKIC